MIGFIDDHSVVHVVSVICRVLPIAPSTYYACLAVRADPSKANPDTSVPCPRDIGVLPLAKAPLVNRNF